MISPTRPFQNNPDANLIDGDMSDSDDFTSPVVDCKFFKNVHWTINYTVTGVPIGVWSVQVADENLDASFSDYPLLATMVTFVTGDGALAAGVIDISGVGAGKILLNINDPFGFVRVKYTFTSDGAGALAQIIGGAR